MNDAINIVEKIMNDEDNYEKWGLDFPEKRRRWKSFNLIVGENGAGKSRILQLIKEKASKECIVFYLDFANYKRSIDKLKSTLTSESENGLIDQLFFGKKADYKIFGDFLPALDTQILSMFNELLCLNNNEVERVKKRSQDILDDLNPSMKDILHREIKIGEDGISLCKEQRNVPISEEWEVLSPGEWSILLVVFAVLFIKLEGKPCILLIDELETHLHPDAQIKLYELLKKNLQEAGVDHCTCIASHSIFLLSHFNISELVYMHNGRIEKINGGLYQQIYDNLTGEGNRQSGSLSEFLYSVSAWQYADYLAQCFMNPTTVDAAKADDEQALQFVEVIKRFYDQKEKIAVLDFGAGSGRIGKCLELMLKDNEDASKWIHKLTYNIYDKYGVEFNGKCNYDWIGRNYVSESEISSSGVKFDIILLYNVLHEIGVDEWVKELRLIFNLLSEDGMLVFGEREVLTIGERPYGKSGYLVLGKDELFKLFPEAQIEEIILPREEKIVTICFAIKKPSTKNNYPKKDNVRNALRSLKDSTKDKIRNRDKNGLGERNQSRRYAFYCQQYVNVEEAIELLKKPVSNMSDQDNETNLDYGAVVSREAEVKPI